MSINNKKSERGKKLSFSRALSPSVFIISAILLAGSGFALANSAITPISNTFAQELDNNTAAPTPRSTTAMTTTTTTNTSSGIQLSSQPVLQERTITSSTVPINQTHMSATFSGNGSLTLPNTSETINYSTNGTAIISLTTNTAQAKETLMTEQGETATATFYEIVKFDPTTVGEGKGLTMALIQTDSTGTLAPLNGTILAGISDMRPNGENSVTLWEWESGIGNNTSVAASPTT
jgi:hypothetical protein